jgi:hypothetical protein
MRADGWYPDPGQVHELRYLDHEQWTEFVSDHGLVGNDALAPRRRRRWPWVAGGIAGALLLTCGALVAVGLDRSLDELDVYVGDLTSSSSGFPTSTSSHSVRSWSSAGYRMSVLDREEAVAAGIMSPTPHTVLAFRVDAVPQDVPVGAEFGVQCWQDEGRGYGLLVSSSGATRLVAGSVPGLTVTTLDTATVPPLVAGRPLSLTLACDVIGDRAILAGYVDGVRVLTARPVNSLTEIGAGGMVVWTGTEAPATWTVTRFERMGVHTMPDGWRG